MKKIALVLMTVFAFATVSFAADQGTQTGTDTAAPNAVNAAAPEAPAKPEVKKGKKKHAHKKKDAATQTEAEAK